MNNYTTYRCLYPKAIETNNPWFPLDNVCPCNPELTNPTGRSVNACPFGVQFDTLEIKKEEQLRPLMRVVPNAPNNDYTGFVSEPVSEPLKGSLFPANSYVPNQKQPRALSRIGYEWRSAF